MAMPLNPKKPHELIAIFNRLVGWLQISPLPGHVRGELLLNVSRSIAILAGVTHGNEEESEGQEAPQSREIYEGGRTEKAGEAPPQKGETSYPSRVAGPTGKKPSKKAP
jgi:hypothetical protein